MNESWTLVLETSVPQASLVLACGEAVVVREEFISERTQEVDLFGPLEQLLGHLPAGERLSAVVVGTGPGSYNGARVGIASAQAVAQVHDCGVAGLCSFEGVSELAEGGFAVGDARRGSLFRVELVGGRVTGAPDLMVGEEFRAWLETQMGEIVSFEDVARLKLSEELEKRVRVSRSTADGLFQGWIRRSDEERKVLLKQEVEAFYLRPPHITRAKK